MFGRRTREYDDDQYTRHRRGLRIRRLVGTAIILAVIWGVFWVFFLSGLVDPVITAVQPFMNSAATMINEPLGIDWGGQLAGIAVIVIPHIALFMFIFDDSMR